MTTFVHLRLWVTLGLLSAGFVLPLTGAEVAGPPNPEKRKPEVKANWDRLGAKIRQDIEKIEPYLYRTLNVYWAEKAPVLDGKLDDRCWTEAEVADQFFCERDFYQNGLKLPVNATEVRVCYDAANLYVAYKLYDREIDKLSLGQPQDYHDIIDCMGDEVEIFLDPALGEDRTQRNGTDLRYFQLAANPRGTTYDARGYGGLEWNPEWEVKTSIQNDSWIVEARIPFRCLNFPSEPTATPQLGDVWGALFARDQATRFEWSRWTSAGIGPTSGYHAPKDFGRLFFKGRKDGGSMPVIRSDRAARLAFGHNELAFAIEGAADAGAFILTRNGKVATETAIKPSADVRIPFELTEGGDLHAQVTFTRGGLTIYQYDLGVLLPMAVATLARIQNETGILTGGLERMRHPQAKILLAQCRALGHEADGLKGVFESGAVEKKALDAFTKLDGEWRAFAFDAERLKLYPTAQESCPYTVLPVDAYTKVFARHVPTNGVMQAVKLDVAGNERESFQVAIVPFWRDLKDVNVTVTPLAGATNLIAASNVECFRVDYVQHDAGYRKTLPGYDPGDPESLRDWPDILWPVTNGVFKAPADRITTLWFDVLCPAGIAEGAYRGEVTLSAEGQTVSIPVTLTAAGFDIPRFPTLRHGAWLSYGMLAPHYGAEFGKKIDEVGEFLKLYENDLRLLDKYRMAGFPFGPDCWSWIKTYFEPDGSYTFDFSELATVIRLGRKYGANWFTASFGCNPGTVMPIYSGSQPVIERATGKTLALRDCPNMKPSYALHPTLMQEGSDPYDHVYRSPFYTAFLAQYTPFLKDMGMLEYSYFEQYDESQAPNYIPGHRTLRRLAPGLPLMNEGPHPLAQDRQVRGVGYADRWEPNLAHLDDPELVQVLHDRRNRFGETYGFYVCGAMERADGRCNPYIKMSQPSVAPRVLSWFAWKYRVDHMLVYMMYAGVDGLGKDWPEKQAMSGIVGYSPLAYPGPAPDYGLIPSIRLVALRDGLEDYEYFKMLHDLTAYLDDQFPPHKDLLDRIDSELDIEPEICKNSTEWTGDPAKLRVKRAKLAKLIREAQAMIAAYPESRLKETR